jgi:carbamoyltransferase
VRQCLDAAGITVDDLALIVSSLQGASVAGGGLHRPLVTPDFDLFDPRDRRHIVMSHHLAHAYSAFLTSGFNDAGVLVCDLGGTSSEDGDDFVLPFHEWSTKLVATTISQPLVTECVSLYDASAHGMTLKAREFVTPHNAPDIFVHSLASLYDNVARFVFQKENAHGELMALAAYAAEDPRQSAICEDDLVDARADGAVTIKNGWQQDIDARGGWETYVGLARACQRATERVLLAYLRRLRDSTNSRNVTAAGGVLLNILANSAIARSGLFDQYWVPSAPHYA